MRLKLLACLFAFLVLTLPTQVLAEGAFSQGKELFDSGDFSAALEKFRQVLAEDPGNLDASFYLGRAAFEAGDYETAVMAYERILLMDPDARRVKLELARCHLSLGSRDIAREYFRSVQATNPPPVVWQQIQQYIAAIDNAEQQHFFNGFITLGLMYDDNVGAAPTVGSVTIGDFDVHLDQKSEGDVGFQATAVLNHIYRFSNTPYSWKSTVTSYNNVYDDQTDYNLNYVGLSTGLIRQDDRSVWEVQGVAATVNLDNERYLDLLKANVNHSRFLSRFLTLNLGMSFQKKYFDDISGRDADTWTVYANPVLTIFENRLGLNAVTEWEDADAEYHSYQSSSVGLRYDRQLPGEFAAYASFRLQQTDYDGKEPFFLVGRSDRQTVWSLGLSKTLWRSPDNMRALATQVSFSHTDNDSNLEIYTYEKDLTLTTLTVAF